jgi:hypothetical protein
MGSSERRQHPRLKIRLPISYRPVDGRASVFCQDYTTDIATGGIQFLLGGKEPNPGDRLEMELSVPPGEGHSPYEGRIRGNATVLRCQTWGRGHKRWAVAAKFDEPLALEF